MTTTFTITENHLKLLKNFAVQWNRSYEGISAPEIDPKRPYGNSDVIGDVANIVGIMGTSEYAFSDRDKEYILKIHRETEIALQICLCTQSFEVGDYLKQDECDYLSWKKIKNKEIENEN